MPAMAIRADRLFRDISAIFAFFAGPFLDKCFYHLWGLVVRVMALSAHFLHLGASIQDIRRSHKALIIHVVNGFAVTVRTGNTLRDVTRDRIVFGEIHMTHKT